MDMPLNWMANMLNTYVNFLLRDDYEEFTLLFIDIYNSGIQNLPEMYSLSNIWVRREGRGCLCTLEINVEEIQNVAVNGGGTILTRPNIVVIRIELKIMPRNNTEA